MTNKILASFAFIVMLAFLSILLIHLPRLDLFCVIGATVLLAGWDLVQNLKGKHD